MVSTRQVQLQVPVLGLDIMMNENEAFFSAARRLEKNHNKGDICL